MNQVESSRIPPPLTFKEHRGLSVDNSEEKMKTISSGAQEEKNRVNYSHLNVCSLLHSPSLI